MSGTFRGCPTFNLALFSSAICLSVFFLWLMSAASLSIFRSSCVICIHWHSAFVAYPSLKSDATVDRANTERRVGGRRRRQAFSLFSPYLTNQPNNQLPRFGPRVVIGADVDEGAELGPGCFRGRQTRSRVDCVARNARVEVALQSPGIRGRRTPGFITFFITRLCKMKKHVSDDRVLFFA